MATPSYDYDVAVVGGGSGGYAAARTAAALGARTIIIEGGPEVGGLCILRGCMPSKALLESAHRWHEIGRAKQFGLNVTPIGVDMKAVQNRKKSLVEDFASYRREQLCEGNFMFVRGRAAFEDPHTLVIQMEGKEQRVTASTFILATGSVIKCVPVPGMDKTGFLISDSALLVDKAPKSLAVLGGGVIAVELGQFFARVGVKTTLLQRGQRLVRTYDEDVSAELERAFAAEGIDVKTGVKLVRIERTAEGKKVTFQQGGKLHELVVDEILCAMGRDPAVEGIGLDRAGVEVNDGKLKLADTMATSVPHIFAAGDVAGMHEVVHIAIQQGEWAARNAVKVWKKSTEELDRADYRLKTLVTFTDPEIASVGLSEAEAREAKIDFLTAQYPFDDHGKSQISGHEFGFVKLIAEKTRGEIIGAQIIGPHASDLIHELIAVMHYHGTVKELAAMPHYHPTLSEIVTYPAEELVDKLAKK